MLLTNLKSDCFVKRTQLCKIVSVTNFKDRVPLLFLVSLKSQVKSHNKNLRNVSYVGNHGRGAHLASVVGREP